MTRAPFVFLYLLAASVYAVLPTRMAGGGLDLVAYGIFRWFGSSPDDPGNLAGVVLQSVSPIVLLATAYFRGRTIGSRVPVYVTIAAMAATWLHPIFLLVARPLGLLTSSFGEGLSLIVVGLDVALPAALYGACMALALQLPVRRPAAVT